MELPKSVTVTSGLLKDLYNMPLTSSNNLNSLVGSLPYSGEIDPNYFGQGLYFSLDDIIFSFEDRIESIKKPKKANKANKANKPIVNKPKQGNKKKTAMSADDKFVHKFTKFMIDNGYSKSICVQLAIAEIESDKIEDLKGGKLLMALKNIKKETICNAFNLFLQSRECDMTGISEDLINKITRSKATPKVFKK